MKNYLFQINRAQIIIAAVVFALVNWWSIGATERYMSKTTVPPSFRHMDRTSMDHMVFSYLASKDLNEHTTIVFGDCVTFGHGVKQSFVNFLGSPEKYINVSMQEFPQSLFLPVIEYSRLRGVKKFVFQLHPFEHFFDTPFFSHLNGYLEESEFQSVKSQLLISGRSDIEKKKVALAPVTKKSRLFFQKFGPFPDLERDSWKMSPASQVSDTLDNLISSLPLYRNRFIIDHGYGLQKSVFSNRQNRIDSYTKPLSAKRQEEILKKMNYIFGKFIPENEDEFYTNLSSRSSLKYLLEYLSAYDLKGFFFMAPTIADKVTKFTDMSEQDWKNRMGGFKRLFADYSFPYWDLSSHGELIKHMRHYDNVTVEGHKILADVLKSRLAEHGIN